MRPCRVGLLVLDCPGMLNRLRCLALATAMVGSACSFQEVKRPDVVRPELVIPARATDVVTGPSQAPGGVDVSYQVNMPYPANALMTSINAALPLEQWRPLEKRLLDATAETIHSAGWTTAVVEKASGDRILHAWDGEWLDRDGNLVAYSLRYDSPWVLNEALVTHPTNSALRVVATWLPASTVAALKRASLSR